MHFARTNSITSKINTLTSFLVKISFSWQVSVFIELGAIETPRDKIFDFFTPLSLSLSLSRTILPN